MQQTLINHPALKVRLFTGREGPVYDPHAYEELQVDTPTERVVAHVGLAVFVAFGSQRIDAKRKDYDDPLKWINNILNDSIGFSWSQIFRIHQRIATKCPKGGDHETVSMDGYIGEKFEVCTKCRKTVNYYFCESAVI